MSTIQITKLDTKPTIKTRSPHKSLSKQNQTIKFLIGGNSQAPIIKGPWLVDTVTGCRYCTATQPGSGEAKVLSSTMLIPSGATL